MNNLKIHFLIILMNMNSKKQGIQFIEIEVKLVEFAKEISEVLEDNFIGFYVFWIIDNGRLGPREERYRFCCGYS